MSRRFGITFVGGPLAGRRQAVERRNVGDRILIPAFDPAAAQTRPQGPVPYIDHSYWVSEPSENGWAFAIYEGTV